MGDSGGPLLIADADLQPRVLAILSTGDASCRGVDHYVRLDAQHAWLAGRVAAAEQR